MPSEQAEGPHNWGSVASLGRTKRHNKVSTRVKTRSISLKRINLIIVKLFLILQVAHTIANAQFLFTYEINSESDDSREPKSSLFDPSSFKIVTPAQLQSTYNRLASQVVPQPPVQTESQSEPPQVGHKELPSEALHTSTASSAAASEAPQHSTGSFLKQTSAALQSFAELFNLAPSSSPAPLGQASQLATPVSPVAVGDVSDAAQRVSQTLAVDQQAEARSLQEHWTQQQQRAHEHSSSSSPAAHQSALHSFASSTAPSVPSSSQSSLVQPHPQHQLGAQQSPPAASYWLTANPLTPPDGNFLVEVKQPDNNAANVVDNLLTLGQLSQRQSSRQQAPTSTNRPLQAAVAAAANRHFEPQPQQQSAQNSFLSTPVSYYPQQQQQQQQQHQQQQQQHQQQLQQQQQQQLQQRQQFQQKLSHSNLAAMRAQQSLINNQLDQSQPLHNHQARSLQHQHKQSANFVAEHNLQPPANEPENFPSFPPSTTPTVARQPQRLTISQEAPLKSAEESLIAFRQSQHEQQNALLGAQHQLNAQREHQRDAAARQAELGSGPVALGAAPQDQPEVSHKQTIFAPTQEHKQERPQTEGSNHLVEIPKVSPQIYESFLLQRKDQFEKHMELLKQQQELNKLLEQKQKQLEQSKQNQEAQRRRKKEELERQEARKKAARQQELENKLKQEQEERRRRAESIAAAEQERKRQQLAELEARRAREQRERDEQARRAKAEERQKERERERELAAERERREEQEAKLRSYLKQQEELRKLLELKQKEDEAAARRRQEAASRAQQPAPETPARSVGNTPQRLQASRLALEHRERSGTPLRTSAPSSSAPTSGWGAPLRSSRSRSATPSASTSLLETSSEASILEASSIGTLPPVSSTTTLSSSSLSTNSTSSSAEIGPTTGRRIQKVVRKELKRRQKASVDEKLIRDKIPLYSGAGKYGLYRGSTSGNDTTLAELAALLDSVNLPSSTSTTTSTTTTTTTPAPNPFEPKEDSLTSSTPLSTGSSINFDDDVPRRPARSRPLQLASSSSSTYSPPVAVSRPRQTVGARGPPPTPGNFSTPRSTSPRSSPIGLASLPADLDNDGIPGRAGVEYPVLGEIPRTSFSCSKQPLNGYYADTETACQVVHLCQGGVQSSILCPNGTIFNQEKFSCQWWYEVNCSRAPKFYQLNDNLYKTLPTTKPNSPNQDRNKEQDQEEADLMSISVDKLSVAASRRQQRATGRSDAGS